MDTNHLIAALTADSRYDRLSLSKAWWLALGLAMLAAIAVFAGAIGPRPDIAQAAGTPRFLLKFALAFALMAGSLETLRRLSRPGGAIGNAWPALMVAPAALAFSVIFELVSMAPDQWQARLIGTNSLDCLTLLPAIGIGPLAVFLVALHHGAATRPGLAGALAGLAAGGIAATFYAAKCTDDSPLFVATWYPIAILVLTAVGYMAGRLFVRW